MKGRSSKAVSSALLAVVALGAAQLPAVAQGVADRAHETARATLLPRRSSGRVVIIVSTDLQRLTVYDDGAPVATTTVSTGIADHPTPHGIFSIIAKERFHRSNLYSDAPMPWMQRITWSGVALHEGHVTGRPASHGCIRMPAAFATDLYRYTREGARVIIARDDVVPVPWGTLSIFNAGLERLAMTSATPAPAAQDTPATPDNLEIEGRPRITSTPWPLDRRDIAAKAPLSLLVNRKSGKLYVRRAFMPVFQIPITIDEPTRPLGTHLFVMQDNPSRWLAMSADAPVREAALLDDGRRGRRMRDVQAVTLPPSDAQDALSRVHLPPGTDAYIASLLTPGASLILSDDGARNRETWDGTNFIALSE